VRRLALVALLAFAVGGVAWAAAGGGRPAAYPGSGGSRTGLRPTGVGLPAIGQAATSGAGELPATLRRYHDSGAYGRDLRRVGRAARAELRRRLVADAAPPRRVCRVGYRRARHGLFERVRRCRHRHAGAIVGRPAIVLDIDETSLSNYAGLDASDFTAGGLAATVAGGQGTAIAATLALYRAARRARVAVFFITGRPAALAAVTRINLRRAGYRQGWQGLKQKPGGAGVEAFKAGARAVLERRGYDILVNVGDQESDLDGGHADAAFKLPDPFYFIPD
jgi:HAD superfamily, subfamily IIIB (Acid phosphatase)